MSFRMRRPPARAFYLLAVLLLLGALTMLALNDELRPADSFVDQRLTALREATSVHLWQFFTDMGSSGALFAVGAVASLLLWRFGRAASLGPLWLAGLGATATTWTAKYLLALPRPEVAALPLPVSPTFPSAHATGAMAVYGIVSWLAGRGLARPTRLVIAAAAAVLIIVIGGSRVILGVHYASDVAAGFLVGGFWLLLAVGTAARTSPT